jgi:hypothetical protein
MMVESPGSSGAFALCAGMIGNVQMDENRINEARPRTSGQRIAVHCQSPGW